MGHSSYSSRCVKHRLLDPISIAESSTRVHLTPLRVRDKDKMEGALMGQEAVLPQGRAGSTAEGGSWNGLPQVHNGER